MIFWVVWLIGIVVGIITTITNPSLRTIPLIAENLLFYQLTVTITLTGFICFIGHVFTDRPATKNGWPKGNLFEKELGFSQLGWAFGGILSIGYKGSFRIGIIIVFSTMMIGAAMIHIVDGIENKNFTQGKPMIVLIDLLMPATLIVLSILAKIW